MQEELEYLDHVEMDVWKVLALHVKMDEIELRCHVIQAGHIQKAFVNVRTLERFKQPPWSLCRGDVVKNLENLRDKAMPFEPTTFKIWKLMQPPLSRKPDQVAPSIHTLAESPATMSARHHPDFTQES